MSENLRPEDICQDWMERAQNAEYLVAKLEARVAQVEAACAAMREALEAAHEDEGVCSCPGGPDHCALDATNAGAKLLARLRAAERVMEAAKLAREELRHAPCRDNPKHTLCLKCAAERALDEALAAWEEAKQC